MTADDSINCRCANSGMTGQVGGFQNPGVCLQTFPSFLPHPLPALLLTPFSSGLVTIVPRSLLLNRTLTLATQARSYEDKNDTPSTLSKNHEDSQKPYSIGRYTQYLAHVWAATGTTVVSFSIFLNAINSSVGP